MPTYAHTMNFTDIQTDRQTYKLTHTMNFTYNHPQTTDILTNRQTDILTDRGHLSTIRIITITAPIPVEPLI